ncbi:hypothetical protein LMG29542_03007 [Paraburkholderia humisilvae]|uniref:HTH marR-type domain-containing protein n=2 Tax=Paraburkholderia humisilvae TaxID=627669 RepID=A0A6J5DUD0_9BURK|nr:hypothetical protein LMG29542_03007 [Paraburkholderia humisilvae]
MTESGHCNATALRRAVRKVSMFYDAHMAPCDLKATQRSILTYIERAGSPTMGELAEYLVLCRSAVTHNLRPLERDGFVSVKPAPHNRRVRIVRLTAKGRKKLEESTVYWQTAQDRFESAFGKRTAADLRAVLDVIGRINF